ncbi:zinc finger protein ZFP2-like [Phlebotomus argentipes]|uniref:zinc finger protein ZFP2-like n=1 Tax=Phlebotomus argentipes TaxID=94469 RepID=UPI0028935C67|nr:zinc finger protein ZFP2-like [Phlebotomus argentipes]
MEGSELLCDARICRLCGESNSSGYQLFDPKDDQASSRLSNLINQYLPVKVKDDGKFPRWICPGCNIQVETTVEFFDLIIRGQEKLRELQREEWLCQEQSNSTAIIAYEDLGQDLESVLFPTNHTLSLKAMGVEKPRKKRGRPPKPSPEVLEAQRLRAEEELLAKQRQEAQEREEQGEDGRRKRKIRAPARFQGVVQGKELEKVYVAEGVIDKTGVSDTEESAQIIENATEEDGRGSQVIGHLKSSDGVVLSDLVVTQKVEFHRKGRVARLKTRFMCDVCSKTFSQELRFLSHRATHQNVRYECTECLEHFLKREELKEHQSDSGHKGQGIVESVKVAKADSSAIEEAAKALYDLQNDKTVMPQISEIDEDFMNIPELDLAFDPTLETQATFTATKKFTCSLCKMAFSYLQELRSHMTSHRTPPAFHCDVCQRKFTDPAVVVLHKETEHSGVRRFACNKCDKEFMQKHQLQKHQNVHIAVRPFECSVCRKRFKTKPHMQYHALCHSQEKRYGCDLCGQRFHYNAALKHHYRWHAGHKPFKCQHCGKSFLQRGILKEHVRIHTGERPFKCQHCEMSFKTLSQCRMHSQRHTNERPWHCEMCTKAFIKLESYKIHMRRHRNEKIFVCDICQKSFAEQYALKKHSRTHTGEKPFACVTCGKTFADRSNMVKHAKQHADAAPPAVSTSEEPKTLPEADMPIVYQILNQGDDVENGQIIFVATYPPKEQQLSQVVNPQADSIIRILDEKNPEEILTMQNISEDPTSGIFSSASIALQLDSTEDYRFLLADK